MTAIGWTSEVPDTAGMAEAVRCTHCGRVYDLDTVTKEPAMVDRHRSGATKWWAAPCCGEHVDNRGDGPRAWRLVGDYVRLDRS